MAITRDQRRRTPRAGNRLGVSTATYGSFGGLGDVGFGTYSKFHQRECPVPEVGLTPFGIDIRSSASKARPWCDCVFGGTEVYAECVNGERWFYPWTALGKVERGWDWEFTDFIPAGLPSLPGGGGGGGSGGGAGGGGGYTPAPASDNSTMLIGGGLLLLAAVLFSK